MASVGTAACGVGASHVKPPGDVVTGAWHAMHFDRRFHGDFFKWGLVR